MWLGIDVFWERLDETLREVDSESALAELCLTAVLDRVPAEGISISRCIVDGLPREAEAGSRPWHSRGRCPLSPELAGHLVSIVGAGDVAKPIVVNRQISQSRSWPYPEVRQAIVRAVRRGAELWGYLTVYNHFEDVEFDAAVTQRVDQVAQLLEVHLERVGQAQESAALGEVLLDVFLRCLQQHDPTTYEHSQRVASSAVAVADFLGCDAATRRIIRSGALLHDIGKIRVDRALLRKPGELNAQELDTLRQHPQLGHDVLEPFEPCREWLPIVLLHHEQPDGRGYPWGLQGDEIPWVARLVSVSDAYDAMTRDRNYRQGCEHPEAVALLEAGSGSQWDGDLVRAFFAARAWLAHS
jgi:putative nucleotidyltransferase with HDIG domain